MYFVLLFTVETVKANDLFLEVKTIGFRKLKRSLLTTFTATFASK